MRSAGGSIGVPRLPIDLGFVTSVLDLLVAGAAELRAKRLVTPEMREDKISERLDSEMEMIHRGSDSDIVNWSMRPNRSAASGSGVIVEVDFSFHANLLPRDQRWYLAVEAKKLRGRGRSLASAYVEEGICRFVSGKYSLGHDHAIMMGYVVVAPIATAVERVRRSMDRTAEKTSQDVALGAVPEFCRHPYTYASTHQQHGAKGPFKLVHLFVEVC